MPRSITPRTSLDNLRREAKRWLKALRASDPEALQRLATAWPDAPPAPGLRDVQRALALEFGLSGWSALTASVAAATTLAGYDNVAGSLVRAYERDDPEAMQTLYDYFGHRRHPDAMRRYVRLGLGRPEYPAPGDPDRLSFAEARYAVARSQGFPSWEALATFASSVPPGTGVLFKGMAVCGAGQTAEAPAIRSRPRTWPLVVQALRETGATGLRAEGQMTDVRLAEIVRISHLTWLDLDGCRELTPAGLRQLARLPGLRHLDLSGCAITDETLELLRELPALRSLRVAWTALTDRGAAHLAACRALERVDLSGTETGDGVVRALAGLPALRQLRSGNAMTDDGLKALSELPVFRRWHGGPIEMALTSPDASPNLLSLRGPFTDAGMQHLAVLDGLFALNVDNAQLAITGAGLEPLQALPHLAWLAFDAKDDSMAAIAALPHLRFLMCQDTSAGDDGFVALSRSRTIEYIWGRRSHNLQRRGFQALSRMPALRSLSTSCLNVDDEGLAALPDFPALTELMPMDIPDHGYRHIARCARLDSLVLMYCRDTTDAATAHLPALTALKKYFASYNRITDRTPEILSGMPSLEEVTFDTCTGLTNDGVRALSRLPRLRRLSVSGARGVTPEVASAFTARVEVNYEA
jgi:hypothetical protein